MALLCVLELCCHRCPYPGEARPRRSFRVFALTLDGVSTSPPGKDSVSTLLEGTFRSLQSSVSPYTCKVSGDWHDL